MPIVTAQVFTQMEISKEATLDSDVHFVGFDVKCNVCNGPNELLKSYAAINDDSEDSQVNFISISVRSFI